MEWDAYLYGFADWAARKSKDATKVGAVLVAPNGRSILLTAFNGLAPGVLDLPERRERPRKYNFATHSERNLIATAARHGIRTEGTIVYCTHRCCAACAGEMIAAGIRRFVYGPGRFGGDEEQWEAASAMLGEARVSYEPAKIETDVAPEIVWAEKFYDVVHLVAPGRVVSESEQAEAIEALSTGEDPTRTALRILKVRR